MAHFLVQQEVQVVSPSRRCFFSDEFAGPRCHELCLAIVLPKAATDAWLRQMVSVGSLRTVDTDIVVYRSDPSATDTYVIVYSY